MLDESEDMTSKGSYQDSQQGIDDSNAVFKKDGIEFCKTPRGTIIQAKRLPR